MPEIIWKYYVGRGQEVDGYLARYRQVRSEVEAARQALMEEYGAKGINAGDGGKGAATGLLFYEKNDNPAFTFSLSAAKAKDGRDVYVGFPNMRTLEGRELAKKLQAPNLVLGRENELVVMMGLSCMADFSASAQTRSSIVWSSAQPAGDAILVKMPAEASKQRILGTAPRIPKYLKLIDKEKYESLLRGETEA